MPIPYQCSHCNFRGKAADKLAGQVGNCPKCKQPIEISEAGSAESPIAEASQEETARMVANLLKQPKAEAPGESRTETEKVIEALDASAGRRDELLTLIADRLWWIALWGCLIFFMLLLGCPTF